MELALSLGMPVSTLEAEMTGVEFHLWQRYAAKRMLPWRRMELHLAQVCAVIVKYIGGNADVGIDDFLFDEIGDETEVETAEEFFGFNPRNRKPQQQQEQ